MPVYKKDNGTYYASFYYTDWTGKKIKKKKESFKTKRDAMIYEKEFIIREQGTSEMDFKTLVSIYMEDCRARLKPTTYSTKEFIINYKILPYFSELQIASIEPTTIRKWQNTLLVHENEYSPTYLKTINNQVSAIFNYAMKYYKLPSNPARISGSIGKKRADTMLFWTKEEFRKFINAVEDKDMSKIMFELLFWTGMRSGELLALTLDDFKFKDRVVSVNKSYARYKGEDLIQEPKTPKSKRNIIIPEFLCEEIRKFSERRYDYRSDERLFPMTKFFLHHEMKRGCQNSGVKKIRVHDLRHSHASLLIEMGFSPLIIAERLGHEDIQTTLQTYSHLYPNKQEEVANRLEELNRR